MSLVIQKKFKDFFVPGKQSIFKKADPAQNDTAAKALP